MSLRSLLAAAFLLGLLLAPPALAASHDAGGRPDTALIVAVGLAGAGLISGGSAGPRRPM
jgi:hypothetical protein